MEDSVIWISVHYQLSRNGRFKNETIISSLPKLLYSDYTGARDENNPQSEHTLTKSITNNANKWNKLKFSTSLNTCDIKRFTTGGDGELTIRH